MYWDDREREREKKNQDMYVCVYAWLDTSINNNHNKCPMHTKHAWSECGRRGADNEIDTYGM